MNTSAIKMTSTQKTQNQVWGKLPGEFKLKGILATKEYTVLQGVHLKFLLLFSETENQGKFMRKVCKGKFEKCHQKKIIYANIFTEIS
jgi:hypothetical protein